MRQSGRHILNQLKAIRLKFLNPLLEAAPGAEIADQGDKQPFSVTGDFADDKLRIENRAVLSQALDLSANAWRSPPQKVAAAVVRLWRQHAEIPPNNVARRIAEQRGRFRADRAHHAVLVERNDSVEGGVHHRRRQIRAFFAFRDAWREWGVLRAEGTHTFSPGPPGTRRSQPQLAVARRWRDEFNPNPPTQAHFQPTRNGLSRRHVADTSSSAAVLSQRTAD